MLSWSLLTYVLLYVFQCTAFAVALHLWDFDISMSNIFPGIDVSTLTLSLCEGGTGKVPNLCLAQDWFGTSTPSFGMEEVLAGQIPWCTSHLLLHISSHYRWKIRHVLMFWMLFDMPFFPAKVWLVSLHRWWGEESPSRPLEMENGHKVCIQVVWNMWNTHPWL